MTSISKASEGRAVAGLGYFVPYPVDELNGQAAINGDAIPEAKTSLSVADNPL